MSNPKLLPRLLYVGDIPVESTLASSSILYRLLQTYPAEKLQIVESNMHKVNPQKRLLNVKYYRESFYVNQLLNSRFHKLYGCYLLQTPRIHLSSLKKIINKFNPEAILTAAHGFFWIAAALAAKQFKLPLHLIIHDDWISYVPITDFMRVNANRVFEHTYQQARLRLCISPYMVEEYKRRYNASGVVLYPLRGEDTQSKEIAIRRKPQGEPLIFGYAGSISSPSYVKCIDTLSTSVRASGGTIVIYSSITKEAMKQMNVNTENIVIRPLLPYQKLITQLRDEVDVLFVPMSFSPNDKINMQLGFPSKLADYTAVGLPLLIYGPPYCSAVRWANANPCTAEVIDQEEPEKLRMAIQRLQDQQYRVLLAENALKNGDKYFAHKIVKDQFYEAVTGN